MKSKLKLVATLIVLTFVSNSFGQGCETLLMNGVFNTFNSYSGSYSSAEWHNYWCNGTVEKINSSSSSSAGLNLGFAKISLGMSYDDAKEFQKVYQSINCGSNAGATQNFSTNSVIQKVASPEILKAYVDCKKLQSSGLIVDMSVRPDDKKVFVVDVKFTGAWQTGGGPKVKKVSFLPNVVSAREGSLVDGVELKNGQTFSMICERTAEYPVTVYVETEAGTFHADLSPTIPPPTDQEKVMGALPRGTILGWFDPTRIPKGWALCDGNNGTPNLNEKFPMGTVTGKVGETIGNASVTPTGSANINDKAGAKAWDVDTDKHTGGSAVAWNRGTVNTVPLSISKVDLIPPATKIMFIMKL